jgi:hypothetical protein
MLIPAIEGTVALRSPAADWWTAINVGLNTVERRKLLSPT